MSERNLREHELLILRFLDKNRPSGTPAYGNIAIAFEQNDGGMGSIQFREKISSPYHKAGSCEFYDTDNKLVIVDLFIDELSQPTELSFWKIDFSPVIKFPVSLDDLVLLK